LIIISKVLIERLKIIRILANKKWKLETKTLINIYKSLIGSIIEYSSIIYNLISNHLKEFLSVVQHSAIRANINLDFTTNRFHLIELSRNNNLDTIEQRTKRLNTKYFLNAININNPMIIKLIHEYKIGFTARKIKKRTPICQVWKEIKNLIH